MPGAASNRSTSIRSCCSGTAGLRSTRSWCWPATAREDAMLRVEHLTKIFENVTDQIVGGIRDAAFELEAGSFFTLLGPSGCGKTTTLRCIAGLETPDAGTIVVAGQPFFSSSGKLNVPANRRGLGMVFQSYAIWPHMDVAANVAFPLKARPRAQRPAKAE